MEVEDFARRRKRACCSWPDCRRRSRSECGSARRHCGGRPPRGLRATCWASGARGAVVVFNKAARRIRPLTKVQARHRDGQTQGLNQLFLEADFDGEIAGGRRARAGNCRNANCIDSQVARPRERADFSRTPSEICQPSSSAIVGHANCPTATSSYVSTPLTRADVSPGSERHDILGVAAIIGVQATDYQKLYRARHPSAPETTP